MQGLTGPAGEKGMTGVQGPGGGDGQPGEPGEPGVPGREGRTGKPVGTTYTAPIHLRLKIQNNMLAILFSFFDTDTL